jgi:hypothetical protein
MNGLRMAFFGFLGGGLLQILLVSGGPLLAEAGRTLRGGTLFIGHEGRTLAYLEKSAGDGSAFFFFNRRSHSRLLGGIYPENPANPLLALTPDDATSNVKELFRLAGGNHSGVIVIKDKPATDRLVLGLNLGHPDEEPFLAYWENGQKKLLFGNF